MFLLRSARIIGSLRRGRVCPVKVGLELRADLLLRRKLRVADRALRLQAEVRNIRDAIRRRCPRVSRAIIPALLRHFHSHIIPSDGTRRALLAPLVQALVPARLPAASIGAVRVEVAAAGAADPAPAVLAREAAGRVGVVVCAVTLDVAAVFVDGSPADVVCDALVVGGGVVACQLAALAALLMLVHTLPRGFRHCCVALGGLLLMVVEG